jgi:hypothetical protein
VATLSVLKFNDPSGADRVLLSDERCRSLAFIFFRDALDTYAR